MSILAIIPARSGSKRVPNKNIKSCGGKPLIAWTLLAANKSKLINQIVISSDSQKIFNISNKYGTYIKSLRPKKFSGDKSMMLPLLQHEIKKKCYEKINYIVLLQPTSPLRTENDIDNAIKLIKKHKSDSVVSITKLPDSLIEAKKIMIRSKDGLLRNIDNSNVSSIGLKRNESNKNIFLRNGPAIAVVKKETILSGSLYGDRIIGFEMPLERSIDINNLYDFKIANLALRNINTNRLS